MSARHYVFEAQAVRNFKYCPQCGEEISQVYSGDYRGFIECNSCVDVAEFVILEEMIERHPRWIIEVITDPYLAEIERLREYTSEQARKLKEESK